MPVKCYPSLWMSLVVVVFFCVDARNVHAQQNGLLKERPSQYQRLKQFCVDCHGDGESNGNFVIEALDPTSDSWNPHSAKLALDVIHFEEMPPSDCDQIPSVGKKMITDWLRHSLKASAPPPASNIRRLSRVEYENTIRDLFRMSQPAFSNPDRIVFNDHYFNPASGKMSRHVLAYSHFSASQKSTDAIEGVPTLPVDAPAEHGFNNQADALSFSPVLVERYFDIAKSLLDSPDFPRLAGVWPTLFEFPADQSNDALRALAKERITVFLPRVFRRPVTPREIERYQNLFSTELNSGGDATAAMKTAVSTMLVSTHFLFRADLVPPEDADEITRNFALAARLSYFLWASMPDDELLQSARENQLSNRSLVARQITRMMLDRKSKSLATDFGMQWLKVRKIATAAPNREQFGDFYRRVNGPVWTSMQIEQLLLFETIMVENRSVLDFIDTDFAYLNNDLMRWYNPSSFEPIGYTPDHQYFEDFFRVKLTSRVRGGVLTSGAMLASTSATTRTSPVYRGAWIAEVIFNRPPPPPPGDVPELEATTAQLGDTQDVRSMLAQHRANPACASCHDRIDPLGLAFENYDAVGRRRAKYSDGKIVDPRGELFGVPFDTAPKFKMALVGEHPEKFVRAFTEHTMKYALSRSLDYGDEVYLQEMTRQIAGKRNRFKEVIRAVALSAPFLQYKSDEK